MNRTAIWTVLCLIVAGTTAIGGVRHFTYVYETPTSAPGGFELENWVTWLRTGDPQRADEVAFRHEIEIGLTDRFQASIYYADWSYFNSGHESQVSFSD